MLPFWGDRLDFNTTSQYACSPMATRYTSTMDHSEPVNCSTRMARQAGYSDLDVLYINNDIIRLHHCRRGVRWLRAGQPSFGRPARDRLPAGSRADGPQSVYPDADWYRLHDDEQSAELALFHRAAAASQSQTAVLAARKNTGRQQLQQCDDLHAWSP